MALNTTATAAATATATTTTTTRNIYTRNIYLFGGTASKIQKN